MVSGDDLRVMPELIWGTVRLGGAPGLVFRLPGWPVVACNFIVLFYM
jgi:hypothetical protein